MTTKLIIILGVVFGFIYSLFYLLQPVLLAYFPYILLVVVFFRVLLFVERKRGYLKKQEASKPVWQKIFERELPKRDG